jgi:hypothetical protein
VSLLHRIALCATDRLNKTQKIFWSFVTVIEKKKREKINLLFFFVNSLFRIILILFVFVFVFVFVCYISLVPEVKQGNLEILFLKRAFNPYDQWGGHVTSFSFALISFDVALFLFSLI